MNKLAFIMKLTLLLLLFHVQVAYATATNFNTCTEIFHGSFVTESLRKDAETNPWGPLDTLIQELALLRMDLDRAQADNKNFGMSSVIRAALQDDYQKKEQTLIEDLLKRQIPAPESELLERVKKKIILLQEQARVGREQEDQAKAKAEVERHRIKQLDDIKNSTIIDGTRAILHRIVPGRFEIVGIGKRVPVTLTETFDLMATPTTQIIWRKVVEMAFRRFGAQFDIDADPSNFKGDTRPVESISFGDVQLWLDALNALSKIGEPELEELIPGHRQGDFYRLPTEAEWSFVARGGDDGTSTFRLGHHEAELREHGWFRIDSNEQTHPVAQKKPLVNAGNEFYDMYGNVDEWVGDWYQLLLSGGIDPKGPEKSRGRVFLGGSYRNAASAMSVEKRGCGQIDARHRDRSFRFVRARE